MTAPDPEILNQYLDGWLDTHEADLVAVRRDLHAHPELGFAEHRTTAVIMSWLSDLGLSAEVLPCGTGVVCDIGSGPRTIALRADIDALPMPDTKVVDYHSRNDGVCHACGHDAHTAILMGAAAVLARTPGLPGRIRLIFQPAEELMPGGAPAVIAAGALKDVDQIFALHCDPRLALGRIGLRVGAMTAACDKVEVTLTGPGGHTARPHLTADIVYALGKVITELPGMLSRRIDPRAGLSVVWGSVQAGNAANAIPPMGTLRGTIRLLDRAVWTDAERVVRFLVEDAVSPTGAIADVDYNQGVPPVINHIDAVAAQRAAVGTALGPEAVSDAEQSMGGEDFAYYLDDVPGALARLGVRDPDSPVPMADLHRASFDLDERALSVGVRFTAHTALHALSGTIAR